MNLNVRNGWITACLHFSGPLNKLLQGPVSALVLEFIKNKLATQFFFVRYNEGGPHIRLRFKLVDGGEFHEVHLEIEKAMQSFLNQNHLATGAVKYIPYEPELERYGGAAGLPISEMQFQISSETAIKIVVEQGSDVSVNLLYAIILHLSFAHSFGMGLSEAGEFYESVRFNTMGYISTRNLAATQEGLQLKMYERYAAQREMFQSLISNLWPSLDQASSLEFDWLAKWIIENRQIASILKERVSKGSLSRIMESYCHMTNNRLGVDNKDEPFVAFLVAKMISDYRKN